ncbi:MAG: response regulator [Planctomycetes bacterium]|nr:response regulator [Planctomycetota bacterium]
MQVSKSASQQVSKSESFTEDSQKQTLDVLLVEDDPGVRCLVERTLSGDNEFVNYKVETAEDLATAREVLARRDFDSVVLDLGLPDSTGVDTIVGIRKVNPDIPIVVLSALSDHSTAINAIRKGADYYVVKGEFMREMLGRSICFTVERRKSQLAACECYELSKYVNLLKAQILEVKETLVEQSAIKNEIQEQAKRLEEEFENFLDSIPDMVWHIDSTGIVKRTNKKASQLVSRTPQSLIGTSFYELVSGGTEGIADEVGAITRLDKDTSNLILKLKTESGQGKQVVAEIVRCKANAQDNADLIVMAREMEAEKVAELTGMPCGDASIKKNKTITSNDQMLRSLKVRRSPEEFVHTDQQKQYNARVLVVDDDPLNRVLMKLNLDKFGLSIDFAEDGLKALQKALVEQFDLIIMDMHMPEMDGEEAIRNLRERGSEVPVVAMTTDNSLETQIRYKKAGFDDFLYKPIMRQNLYRILDCCLTE